jgi:hypothetical protein
MFNLVQVFLQIPFESAPRTNNIGRAELYVLFFGLTLLLISRFTTKLKATHFFSGIKTDTITSQNGTHTIQGMVSTILLYLIGVWLFYRRFHDMSQLDMSQTQMITLIALIPIILFLPMALVLFLSNNIAQISAIAHFLWVNLLTISVILFIAGISSFLFISKQEHTDLIYYALLFLLLFCFLWIHFRVIQYLMRSGLKWYYIILYFCTLEILPILFLWLKFVKR